MTTDHHERYAQGCKRATIGFTKGSNDIKSEQILKKSRKLGSKAATRLRESGFGSNRGAECHGESESVKRTSRPTRLKSRSRQRLKFFEVFSSNEVNNGDSKIWINDCGKVETR